jgi:hypothetical protein
MAEKKKAADEQEAQGSEKLAKEKAEDQAAGPDQDVANAPLEALSDDELDKVESKAKLPVYNEEERILANHEIRGRHSVVPDTPSGYAVKKVGNLDGEDVDHSKPGASEAAAAHGEAYQREKRKMRWGY